jgi:hypothetical protein
MQRLAVQKIGSIIAELDCIGEPIITPKFTWLYGLPYESHFQISQPAILVY